MVERKDTLAPGSAFGRYTIVRLIGAGGMGSVYEARHIDLKKRVAIKVLPANLGENAELRARFLREGEAMARIRHPHVVDVYDVGVENGLAFLVMEFLEGEDLGGRLRREKPLADETLADIMLSVCSAVAAAHDQNVIHRDLKPANIFLITGAHGDIQPKVLDFGISKIMNDPVNDVATQGLTSTGAVLGTPHYMSPEQAHGGVPLDVRSDEYSLGVILYQCSTGQRPFDAPSMYQVLHKIVQGQFERPSVLRPDMRPEFEHVILNAMAKEPSARYPTVRSLAAALLEFASPRGRALWEPVFGQGSVPTNPKMRGAGGPKSDARVAPLSEPEHLRTPTQGYGGTGSSTLTQPPASSKTPLIVSAAAVLIVVLVLSFLALTRQPESVPLKVAAPPPPAVAAPPPPVAAPPPARIEPEAPPPAPTPPAVAPPVKTAEKLKPIKIAPPPAAAAKPKPKKPERGANNSLILE